VVVKKLGIYGAILLSVGIAALLVMFAPAHAPAPGTVFGRSLICVGFLSALCGFVMLIGAKVRLPIALCVAQTILTGIITFWADRMEWLTGDSNRLLPHFARLHYAILDFRETWRSINAPTFPLNFSGLTHLQVLGFGVGEILYFLAVAALWYLVGYFHERRGMRKSRFVSIAVLVWGVILMCLFIVLIRETALEAQSILSVGEPNAFPYGMWGLSLGLLNRFPYGVWGLLLIWFGVGNLRSFSHMQRNAVRTC
jgi:hypothetical protein